MDVTPQLIDDNAPSINPIVPDSIGALLAEEWTVNNNQQSSVLPSFLEMTMINEARRSNWHMLKSLMVQLEFKLLQHIHSYQNRQLQLLQQEQQRRQGSSSTRTTTATTMSTSATPRSNWWNHIIYRMVQFLLKRIIEPYGLEVRFFLFYFLERMSLLSNGSASISEMMYGTKRVKLGGGYDEVSTIKKGKTTNNGTTKNKDEKRFFAKPSQQEQGQHQSEPRRRRLHPMNKVDAVRLALLLAFGPYLSEKCENYYHSLRQTRSSSSSSSSSHHYDGENSNHCLRHLKVKKIIYICYPFLYASVQGIDLMHRWNYLMGKSIYFDTYSSLLNLIVRRSTVEDQKQKQQQQQEEEDRKQNNDKDNNTKMTTTSTPTVSTTRTTSSSSSSSSSSFSTFIQNIFSKQSTKIGAGVIISGILSIAFMARIRSIRHDTRLLHRHRHHQRQEQEQEQRQRQEEEEQNSIIDNANEQNDQRASLMSTGTRPTTRTHNATPSTTSSTSLFPPFPQPLSITIDDDDDDDEDENDDKNYNKNENKNNSSMTTKVSETTTIKTNVVKKKQKLKNLNNHKRRSPPPPPPAGFCPICCQPFINPTASTGGYVYCFKCLLSSLREQQQENSCNRDKDSNDNKIETVCPITGKPCTELDIIRLFEPRANNSM